MHDTINSGGKGRAKNQGSSNGDSVDVEAREALDVNRVGSVLRESDDAGDRDAAGSSQLGRRSRKANQPTPMSPGGSANQRVAKPDDK